MSSSQPSQISTLKTIESALSLIDSKKQILKRAYDDLQSHSSLLSTSSFSLSWSDLDAHFTSVQTALTRRFLRLQSAHPDPEAPCPGQVEEPTRIQNELAPLCEKMDGRGLRDYINEHSKEREAIRAELVGLMGLASDPGEMVLDAMEGFYLSNTSKGDRDMDLYRLRKSCLDLLEVLSEIKRKPKLSDEVKIKARNLALEWKQKVSLNGDSPLEALGFLNLIVAFELEDVFDVSELLNYFVVIARFKQATVLARAIGLGDKITDLVQKLIDNGKQLLAVKFIFEFGLTDQFQPAPLLRDHLKESRKNTNIICNNGKNSIKAQNEARSREVNALKSVLQYIDEYNLEFEYPRLDLETRIDVLEKQKADKKVAAPSTENRSQQPRKQQQQQQSKKQQQQQQSKKHQQQQSRKQQLNGNKRARTTALPVPAAIPVGIAGSSSTAPPFQQSHLPQTGLLSAAGPYGLVSSTPPIASYAGSSAGPYGLAGAGMGFPGNPNPVGAPPYMSSSYYDRPAAYGGHGFPPQYYPGYYPQ